MYDDANGCVSFPKSRYNYAHVLKASNGCFFWSLDRVTLICTSIYSTFGGYASTHLDLKTASEQEEILRFKDLHFNFFNLPPNLLSCQVLKTVETTILPIL